jgi:hypothetical protein
MSFSLKIEPAGQVAGISEAIKIAHGISDET